MKIHKIDNREIRSFRLRQKNIELQTFFENKNNIGVFMVSDTLHPEDRKSLRKETQEHNLKISLIQKKIIKLWNKTNKWTPIINLLSGNVVKIIPKKETIFTNKTLIYLLQHEQFSFQLLNWNHQLYRKTKIEHFLQKNLETFQVKQPIVFLLQIILKNLILNTKFLIQSNTLRLQNHSV